MDERTIRKLGQGVTAMLRVDRPDGTVLEIIRDDRGEITTTRTWADGRTHTRFVFELLPTGAVVATRQDGDLEPVDLVPLTTEESTNPYGTTIEALTYDGGLTVTQTYDDDVSLRTVSMRGDWGDETQEMRPDGSRTVTWRLPLHEGVETWDASGRRVEFEVTSSDNTSFRSELTPDGTRQTIVDWNGTTKATDFITSLEDQKN